MLINLISQLPELTRRSWCLKAPYRASVKWYVTGTGLHVGGFEVSLRSIGLELGPRRRHGAPNHVNEAKRPVWCRRRGESGGSVLRRCKVAGGRIYMHGKVRRTLRIRMSMSTWCLGRSQSRVIDAAFYTLYGYTSSEKCTFAMENARRGKDRRTSNYKSIQYHN